KLHKALVGMRGGGQRDAGEGRKRKHGGANGGWHFHGSYLRRSCKSESVRRALRHRLSRNYRIVTDRRKGQSAFGHWRDARRTPTCVVYPTQFHHDCTNKKSRPVNCITRTGRVSRYSVSGELD